MSSISVAMATYNGSRYIGEQLASIANQTVKPAELVVCDDGSTDDTIDKLKEFARKAPFPVHFHRNDVRLGYRANFMKCANLCGGQLVCFSDQDDVWLGTKLEQQSKRLESNNKILLSFHNANIIDETGRQIGQQINEPKQSCLLSIDNIGPFVSARGFTQLFRRELLQFSRFYYLGVDDKNEPMNHDGWMLFLATVFGLVDYDSTCLSSYRRHIGNAVGFAPTGFERLAAKMRVRLTERRSEYEKLVLTFSNRVELLMRVSAGLDESENRILECDLKASISKALPVFRSMKERAQRRLGVYDLQTRKQRFLSFIDAVGSGDYTAKTAWHFTAPAAIRDLLTVALPTRR